MVMAYFLIASQDFCAFFSTTCLLKNTNDWYSVFDHGELVGIVFTDLKRLLMLWITKSSVISLPFMVCNTGNWPGLNPLLQIVNNSAGLMVLSQT